MNDINTYTVTDEIEELNPKLARLPNSAKHRHRPAVNPITQCCNNFRRHKGDGEEKGENSDMSTNENEIHNELPPEVQAAFAAADQADHVRDQVTVGALFGSIRGSASPYELLRVAAVGKDLLYAALGHQDATPEVFDEARSMMGPVADAVLEECDLV